MLATYSPRESANAANAAVLYHPGDAVLLRLARRGLQERPARSVQHALPEEFKPGRLYDQQCHAPAAAHRALSPGYGTDGAWRRRSVLPGSLPDHVADHRGEPENEGGEQGECQKHGMEGPSFHLT